MKQDANGRALIVVRWPVGGIRTYLSELLGSTAFADLEFTVVIPRTIEYEALVSGLASNRIRWRDTDSTSGSIFWACASELLRSRYALIHAQGLTAGLIAAPLARLTATPLLLTLHEVFTEGQFRGRGSWLKKRLIGSLLSFSKSIHVVTEDARANACAFIPMTNRVRQSIRVIPHGINTSRFLSTVPRDLRGELALPPSVILLGFFGRFMAPKGFRTLIEAVAVLSARQELPRFLVVCTGSGGFIREDRADIQKRDLERYFRFLPLERDIGPTLKSVDMVIMPSLWEASGLMAMEALVSGVPLISSDCIGLRETTKATPARSFPTGNAAALAKVIEDELLNPSKERAISFSHAAAQRFDANLSFSNLRCLYHATSTSDSA